MTPLILATDSSLKSSLGNFNAVANAQNKTLSFPPEIMKAFSRAHDWNAKNGENALTVLAATYSFPSTTSYYLEQEGIQWTPEESRQAAEKLVTELIQKGHLDPQFLAPSPTRTYGFT